MRALSFARGRLRRRSSSAFVNDEMLKGGKKKIRLDSGVGVKPISITGSKRLVRAAIQYALDQWAQDGDARAQGKHSEVH